MIKCTKCNKRLTKKKTAWINCLPYCRDCCTKILYFKRLERNNKKKSPSWLRELIKIQKEKDKSRKV